jgi:hypothetical protein
VSSTARIVPAADLFKLIGVRDPYFALKSVAVSGDGRVEAEVPVELKSSREAGCITAAEAARHLGLLGSVAAAQVNPNKAVHYYVPRAATLDRGPGLTTATGVKLEASGGAEMKSKNVAHARVALHTRSGALLYTLSVELMALDQESFDRVFKGVRRDLRRSSRPPVDERRPTGELRVMRSNPYGAPLELKNIGRAGGDIVEATFGPISPIVCMGHYPMYPVLPVGLVMTALSQLCGELLVQRAGHEVKYVVRHAAATADNLAVAGETVAFEARYLSGTTKTRLFQGRARAGSKNVGTVALTLSLL